ncbi:MAG TPA: hypothetical protein VHE83_15890 [Mycobacteriales bacterium]|nr:hypothetical protein [Mycobacteriales bacterium]
MRRTAVAVALAAIACGLTGCSGLQFVEDQRLSFTSPADSKLTQLPVTLSWTMKDFATTGSGAGSFAVFIDRAPIKVGHNIRSVLAKNVAFSEQQLEQQNVYVTKDTKVVLTLVPRIRYDKAVRQRHTATVILLDDDGTRRTESAWIRSFDLDAKGSAS